ncbi:MAG TPA: sulfotransferase [Steroidobacteraceae bacterium]|nr:sulfotransferase [Steroidobacteraceae bacterium]
MLKQQITKYVLIVGAMKAGTTTLFRYLEQHPAICPSRPKEVSFFAFDALWNKGLDWYRDCFEFDAARHVWALEGSTDYTKRPHCDGVIDRLRSLPGVEYRIVYIMRNPLRRITSHAYHVDRTRQEIGQIMIEREDLSLDGGISDVWIDISRYAYQIRPYVEAFGRDRVFLTTLEQLEADPQAVVSRVFAFLDLPPHPIDVSRRFNQKRAATSPVALWTRASGFAPFKLLYRAVTPPKLRAPLKRLFSRKRSGFGRFTLNAEEEAYILRELREDLTRLSNEYGIDVERLWGINLN